MEQVESKKGAVDALSISQRRLWLIVLILTFVTYLRTLTFSFVHDDAFHLFSDPRLQSWEHWPDIFSKHLWSPLAEGGNYYRPIILFWFLTQKTLFGFDAFFWHFASVTLHVGVTALVYRLAFRTLNDPLSAAVTALVFGLHPVHIESIAWVSASVDPLMTFFTLAAFLCFLRWNEASVADGGTKALWLAGSLIFYSLAQLTKETAIVFPAVVFFSAIFLGQGSETSWKARLVRALRAMTPYMLVAGLYLVVRIAVLGWIAGSVSSAPLSTLLLTLPGVVFRYMQHLVIPVGLSPIYDTPYITSFSWASVGLPLTVICLVGAGLIYWGQRSKVVPVAVVWMIFPLLPVLNLSLLPEPDRFHDRFLYLPSVGFVLLVGLAFSKLKGAGPQAFGIPLVRVCAAILLCTPLALGAAVQSSHWKDDFHLFRRAAVIAPGNNEALNNFGLQLLRLARLDEAETYFQRVIEREPDHAMSLLNLGRVYFLRGSYKESEQFLLRALKSNEYDPDIYINLGFVHVRMGDMERAEEDFRGAISRSRNRPGYGNALGVFLRDQGRLAEALEVFEAELSLDPSQADVQQQVEQLRARISAQ